MSNIKDVARSAGVSPSTVSRVLNGNGYVSEKTREKILRVVKEIGYTPNPMAKGLKQGMTNTIALVIPSTDNVMFPEIARGIEYVARKNGLMVILCNTNEDKMVEKEYIEKLKMHFVDGFIVCSMKPDYDHIRDLHAEGFPLVLVSRHYNEGIDTVAVDNYLIGYRATKYLIDTGCKDIAVILGPDELNVYNHRFNGYRQALLDCGMRYDGKLVLTPEPNSAESCYDCVVELLKNKKVDAIYATSDPKAVYAMRAIHDLGLKIPDDISVMGVDNLSMSRFIEPPLTTICQPLYNMGVVAMKKLMKQIEYKKSGKEYIPSLEILNAQLIVRKSTRSIEAYKE